MHWEPIHVVVGWVVSVAGMSFAGGRAVAKMRAGQNALESKLDETCVKVDNIDEAVRRIEVAAAKVEAAVDMMKAN